jgi:hypothetical protein
MLGTVNVEEHHLIPKTFKGTETISIHKICHRAIHASLTERELEKEYYTVEKLLTHFDIQQFVKWVRLKPPEYYDCAKETKERKKKRWK